MEKENGKHKFKVQTHKRQCWQIISLHRCFLILRFEHKWSADTNFAGAHVISLGQRQVRTVPLPSGSRSNIANCTQLGANWNSIGINTYNCKLCYYRPPGGAFAGTACTTSTLYGTHQLTCYNLQWCVVDEINGPIVELFAKRHTR